MSLISTPSLDKRLGTPPETLSSKEIKKNVSITSCDRAVSLVVQQQLEEQARYAELQKFVENTIKKKKLYTILGFYPNLRTTLNRRGWLEKVFCNGVYFANKNSAVPNNRPVVSEDEMDSEGEEQTEVYPHFIHDRLPPEDRETLLNIMSVIGKNSYPTFIWTRRRDQINFRRLKSDQIVNHFPHAEFTTKVGLSRCMDDLHWFEDLDPNTFFPRCYKIGEEHEKIAFIEDYHITVCRSILKWFLRYVKKKENNPTEPNPNEPLVVIPLRAIELAMTHCEAFLKIKENEDIDRIQIPYLTAEDWVCLMGWYFQMLNEKVVINEIGTFHRKCEYMLLRLRSFYPQNYISGMHSLWIVKPGAKSRGEGIKIYQSIEDILSVVNSRVPNSTQVRGYVVQKYIERPLLIHRTKFDIRQWFLVSDWNPLTIYFYQECYLRFCSKSFSLYDLSEAAHLCNNAIQKHYKKRCTKSSLIPKEFMWTLDEFKEHLKKQGKAKLWDHRICPGMKKAIIAVTQAAQDDVNYIKNCFEVYGADFMISDDYYPWLIEINSDPNLAPSTRITSRLCSYFFEDVMKVIVDRPKDKSCSIGKFQCIYKQEPIPPTLQNVCLKIQGVAIPRPGAKKLI